MYNLKEYIESVKKFVEDTKDWGYLDICKMYMAVGSDWVETCNNAEGGINVSWAFKLDDVDEDLIKKHFIEEIADLLRCLAIDNGATDLDVSITIKE